MASARDELWLRSNLIIGGCTEARKWIRWSNGSTLNTGVQSVMPAQVRGYIFFIDRLYRWQSESNAES